MKGGADEDGDEDIDEDGFSKRQKKKDIEETRYLTAHLFPPDELLPTLVPRKEDPTAKPGRSNRSTAPASTLSQGVSGGYMDAKVKTARNLLSEMHMTRIQLADQIRRMTVGKIPSTLEYRRLVEEMQNIKIQLNKVAKTVQFNNGDWIKFEPGSISVLLLAYFGDINHQYVDVTTQFGQLLRRGGINLHLDKLDFGVDFDRVHEDDLTIIFIGKAQAHSNGALNKHYTGLAWTPTLTPERPESAPRQEQSPASARAEEPRSAQRQLSEADIALRDMMNGYIEEEEPSHPGLFGGMDVDTMRYHAGNLLWCSKPETEGQKPPTVALFHA